VRLRGPETDAAIVQALRAGHPAGAAALFDRYHEHVRRVLVHVMGPDPDLGDLVQEVFVAAMDSIGGLDRAESLRGWLGSIAVFTARARMRQRRRSRILQFLPQEEMPEPAREPNEPEIDEAVRATYRVLERLPVDERIVFALRFVDGMELADIAASFQTSVSTIKRRLAKARSRFEKLARREPSLVEWLEGGSPWAP
jgi:RNA polymerase sigma-70 factor (ECF subfamily)